ncbi:hypothetical protein D7V95_13825 [bacterium J10(2018)]|jgi:hypothetical protein|nr:hypothetical protein D7V95_13825 [bacterium J10(2018)]
MRSNGNISSRTLFALENCEGIVTFMVEQGFACCGFPGKLLKKCADNLHVIKICILSLVSRVNI